MAATRSPRYSAVAIGLHWAIAGMLVGMIWTGWNMHGPDGREIEWLFQLHKSVGITILLLTIARVIWRVKNPPPPLPADMKGWEKSSSHIVHMVFYAVMILAPLGGWALASMAKVQVPTVLYGTISWPHLPILSGLPAETQTSLYKVVEFLHSKSAWLIIAMLVLHIGGALKHELGEEDGVLKRMIPGLFGKTGGPQAPPKGFIVAFGSAFAAFILVAGGPVLAQSLSGSGPTELQVTPVTSMTPNWEVDYENSIIEFAFQHDGEEYAGSFDDWQADILFMPDNLEASRAVVTVDLTSTVVPKKLYADSLKATEWFDSVKHPQAVVDLTNFRLTQDGNVALAVLEADAEITVKGNSVVVPFQFSLGGQDETVMKGATTIARKSLNLGQQSDPDAEWVSEEIQVVVTVTANQK